MTKRALLGAFVALLAAAAPAAAQDKPTPCTGMAASDEPGDQVYHVPQVQEPTPQAAPTAADLTGAFFTTSADGVVRANLVVSDLDTNYPDPATGVRYSIYYKAAGKAWYVRLILNGDEPTWSYGSYEDNTVSEIGAIKGDVFPGKDGVISFIVPAAAGGTPGTAWTEIWSATSTLVPGSSSSSDYLPDGSSSATGPRFKYSGAKCPGTDGAAPPPSGGGGGTTPPPPSSGGGTPPPSSGGGSGAQPSEAVQLRITAKPTRLKAKKIKKKVVFTLTSNETLTGVTGKLVLGRKRIASGRLAKLDKQGRITLKVRGRARKGAYTLVLTGRRPNGATGTVSIRITVK